MQRSFIPIIGNPHKCHPSYKLCFFIPKISLCITSVIDASRPFESKPRRKIDPQQYANHPFPVSHSPFSQENKSTKATTGEVKQKGTKGVLDDIGELWDENQYTDEYDLNNFIASLGKN